jgi:tetratricopeptide (TPR) repeat protein
MSVADLSDLIDLGIKAYLAGEVKDALAAFQRVLELDPGNPKARRYLLLIHAIAPPAASAPEVAAVPLPAAGRPGAVALPAPGTAGAVRLPAPPAASGRAAPAARVATAAGTGPARPPPPDPEYAPSPWDEGPSATGTLVLESSGGLDLEAVAEKSDIRPLVPEGGRGPAPAMPARNDVEVWLGAAKELFALGDFSGSLELIEKVLQVDPDHAEAREYLAQNEATLVSMYESKLGPQQAVPRLAIKPEEVMWLNLDHRAGFLLAQIDGMVDYEALFALSGLPRLDTARILANLIADGVITS